MGKANTAVLCSGFGLGFYIPGILIFKQLKNLGLNVHAHVFEKYLFDDKKNKIINSKNEYHKDFSVALFAAKMPFDIRDSIDFDAINHLFDFWIENKVYNFISLSGHWGYILDKYRELVSPQPILVDSLFVDCDYAPSWRGLKKFNPEYFTRYNNVWFYDIDKYSINFSLKPNKNTPIPFEERENKLVIHGGGWGMGTYKSKISELSDSNYNLEVVAYNFEDVAIENNNIKYFMNIPDWQCWNIDTQVDPLFPPFSGVENGKLTSYNITENNHWLYNNIEKSKAIICKPGAGTLIDSLSSGTPIVLLEPFGIHEKKNYELWENLGYGISFEDWKKTDYSLNLLKQMSDRIISETKNQKEYVLDFLSRI